MHFTNDLSVFFAFLAVTNPLTTIPLLLAATENSDRKERRRVAILANVASAIILFVSLFAGEAILRVFQIEIDAFRMAGGFLIGAVAWAMATGKSNPLATTAGGRSAIVVPLAIPSLAGPGAIAASIALAHDSPTLLFELREFAALLAVCVVNTAVLLAASSIERVLGEQGMKVLNRLLGLILLGIAVSSILKSLRHFFPGWQVA